MPRGKKPFYASKPSMKESATRSTRATSRAAKASQAGQNLSAVPAVQTLTDVVAAVEGGPPSDPKEPEQGLLSNVEGGANVAAPIVNLSAVPEVTTLTDVVATAEVGPPSAPKEPEEGLLSNVEGGAKVVAPVVVQGPAVVSNDKPVAASGPKELDNGLSLNVAPAPSPVAVGKGNVESSTSSSDDDSSDSGSEESDSCSDSSSTTSSSGSHTEKETEKPVKSSFPTQVGTVVVSTAELVAAASAASVAVAKVLGPDLPSASLFEAPQEEAVPETYGPGEPEEADKEATDDGVMAVTNSIFEEAKDEEETEKEVAIVGLEAEEEQPVCSAEVEDAAMVMQAFGVTSLAGVGKFPWIIICNLF